MPVECRYCCYENNNSMSRRGGRVIVSGGTRLDTTVSHIRYIEGGSSEEPDILTHEDKRRYGVVGISDSKKRIEDKKKSKSNKAFLFSSSIHDEIKRYFLRQRDEELRSLSDSQDDYEEQRNIIIARCKKRISRLRRFDFEGDRVYVKRTKVMSGFLAFHPAYLKDRNIIVFKGMMDDFTPVVSQKGKESFDVHFREEKVTSSSGLDETWENGKYNLKDLYPYSVAEMFLSYFGMYSFEDLKYICSKFKSYSIGYSNMFR